VGPEEGFADRGSEGVDYGFAGVEGERVKGDGADDRRNDEAQKSEGQKDEFSG
jgi:hypothetical protein